MIDTAAMFEDLTSSVVNEARTKAERRVSGSRRYGRRRQKAARNEPAGGSRLLSEVDTEGRLFLGTNDGDVGNNVVSSPLPSP